MLSPALQVVDGERRPTRAFLGLWRASGAASALPAALALVDTRGLPTRAFLRLWRQAFGSYLAPAAAIVTPDRRPTDELLARWREATT